MPEALRRFADDLDDPSADLVIAALILNAKLRGPGLRDMLSALATSARAELDMRRRVEADRRATRRSVRIVVAVSVGTALALAVFNHSYVEPYDDFLGQLVLCVVVALYGAAFLWLRRLSKYELPGRFLSEPRRTAQPGVPGEVPSTVAGWQGGDARRQGPQELPLRGGTPRTRAGWRLVNGAMIAGAVVGLGLYVLVRALFPSRPGLAARMAALDAARRRDLEEQQASRLSRPWTGSAGRAPGSGGSWRGSARRAAGSCGPSAPTSRSPGGRWRRSSRRSSCCPPPRCCSSR